MENKKIANATPLSYDGIEFKSILEKNVYKLLKEEGFPVKYEPTIYTIWEGHTSKIPFYDKFYDKKLKRKVWDHFRYKMLDITYKPDFVFTYNDKLIVIEAKGYENDCFYLKKKLFISHLEENFPNSMYFEVYSLKQLREAINIIRNEKS